MPRIFLGIPLNQELIQTLDTFKAQQNENLRLRWVPQGNLHITLYFFAEVPMEMLANLKSLLSLALKESKAFHLAFDRFVLAPPGQDSRMIWARYQKDPHFLLLHQQIHELYRQVQGKLQRRKSPVPHITLARFPKIHHLKQTSFELSSTAPDIWVKELVLWESVLTPMGAKYEVLERYLLPMHEDKK